MSRHHSFPAPDPALQARSDTETGLQDDLLTRACTDPCDNTVWMLERRATRPDAPVSGPRIKDRDDVPVHDARDLVGPDRQARIVLGDQTYVLRLTRANKLILTK